MECVNDSIVEMVQKLNAFCLFQFTFFFPQIRPIPIQTLHMRVSDSEKKNTLKSINCDRHLINNSQNKSM